MKAVIASSSYAATVSADVQHTTITHLQEALGRLLADPKATTGWQLRQDNTTGTGGELSGGAYRTPVGTDPLTTARLLLRDHGDLFGLQNSESQLVYPRQLTNDTNSTATLRGTQQLGGVPIEGSNLLVVIRNTTSALGSGPEIGFVKAHLFPQIAISTTPQVGADAASRAVVDAGAVVTSAPLLVITPSPPTLAWKIGATYTAPAVATTDPPAFNTLRSGPITAYVNAVTGLISQLRQAGTVNIAAQIEGPPSDGTGGTADGTKGDAGGTDETGGATTPDQTGSGPLGLPAAGTPVTITGTVHGGLVVSVQAEQLADGTIAFIDSSQPGADRATGTGLNIVFDGSALQSDAGLPGPVATMAPGAEPDTDTLTAAWAAKLVLDYYRSEHGRASYDGKGHALVSTVHVPEKLLDCNAYFSGYLGQMVYSGPCDLEGKRAVDSLVDLSIVGHEITHGVTDTTAPFISSSSGQGAALNEGNSDYFGIIIQNLAFGKPYTTEGTTSCEGQPASQLCHQYADGQFGGRNIDSGATFDDAEFVLREPLGLLDDINDIGAAHANSLVWTNALWQIRKAFASEDGNDLITSKAASRFDRIVYRAVTTYFTSETDMSSAASAVLQSAIDLEATPSELDVIQQQFVLSQLCVGCNVPANTRTAVAAGPKIELRPQIVNAGIAYISQTSTEGDGIPLDTEADLAGSNAEAGATNLTPADVHTLTLSGAGDWVVETQYHSSRDAWFQLRNLATGSTERLGDDGAFASPAISANTVVWASKGDAGYAVNARANAGGPVSRLEVPSRPMQLGVDGRQVAFILQNGTIAAWDADSAEAKTLQKVPSIPDEFVLPRIPGAIAVSGSHIAALVSRIRNAIPQSVMLFDVASGTTDVLTDTAYPAGLAMDGSHVVWSEVVGRQASGIAKFLGREVEDSDLMAFSLETNAFAVVVHQRGQQGFPSLKGRLLAWQDRVGGADDIYSGTLPAGI